MSRNRIDGFAVMLVMIRLIPRFAVYTIPAIATPGNPTRGPTSRSEVRAQTAIGPMGSPT